MYLILRDAFCNSQSKTIIHVTIQSKDSQLRDATQRHESYPYDSD